MLMQVVMSISPKNHRRCLLNFESRLYQGGDISCLHFLKGDKWPGPDMLNEVYDPVKVLS